MSVAQNGNHESTRKDELWKLIKENENDDKKVKVRRAGIRPKNNFAVRKIGTKRVTK